MAYYRCDHCGWRAHETELPRHPRLDHVICLDCWLEGFDTAPREEVGPLMEALLDHEPSPRTPKLLIDWTDEDYAVSAKIERAREAHERSDVRLDTTVDNAAQLGFDFMREEFKVAPQETATKDKGPIK